MEQFRNSWTEFKIFVLDWAPLLIRRRRPDMLRALSDTLVGARRAAIAAVNSWLASSTLVSAALPAVVTASSAAASAPAASTCASAAATNASAASAPMTTAAIAASLRARICAERDADCLAGLVRAAGSLPVQDVRTIDGASRAAFIRW